MSAPVMSMAASSARVEQQLDILGLRETRQDAFDASASGASGDPSSIRHHIAPGRMTGEVRI